MKKKLLALLMGTSLVLAACGGGDDEATDTGGGETASVNAEQIYNDKGCVACHGGDLTGGVGPDLSVAGGHLTVDEIKDVIVNGRGAMAAQNVSDEEADALAEWLAAKK
ncbi:cytochrome c551 [Robertmurraya massiliosenegalensis]|uniref:cytochrome c551 n=1 Tax=Robertmurraya TaxID=2837507 RepID=UPI0039A5E7B5